MFFLTSEDCAQCGDWAGESVFCKGCRVNAAEYESLRRWL